MNALLSLMIISCWTPTDSMELGVTEGYTRTEQIITEDNITEVWKVSDDMIRVTYIHPVVGDPDLWCYFTEVNISEHRSANQLVGFNGSHHR